MRTLVFGLTLWGCAGEQIETTELDRGRLCWMDGALALEFRACIGGCETLVEAACTGELDDGTLVVIGSATLETLTGPGVACTTDCRWAGVTCEVPADLPLDTPVTHADSSGTLADVEDCVL